MWWTNGEWEAAATVCISGTKWNLTDATLAKLKLSLPFFLHWLLLRKVEKAQVLICNFRVCSCTFPETEPAIHGFRKLTKKLYNHISVSQFYLWTYHVSCFWPFQTLDSFTRGWIHEFIGQVKFDHPPVTKWKHTRGSMVDFIETANSDNPRE